MDAASQGDEGGGGHLDEGAIHAWLDDALDGPEASAVAVHVMSCAQCTAAVAEARGLIAGASRVVRALDDDAPVTSAAPAWGAGASVARSSRWQKLRVTPSRAAIAAALLVAVGVTLTYPRTAVQETAILNSNASAVVAPRSPALAPSRDPLLDSAIKRNVAAAQPARAIQAATTPAVPRAQPATIVARVDSVAPERVAEGRMAATALRDSSAPAADQARVAINARPKSEVDATYADGAGAVDALSKRKVVKRAVPMSMVPSQNPMAAMMVATECYRVESTVAGASWGPVPLPFLVTLRPNGTDGGSGVVTDTANRDSKATVTWSRQLGDTLRLRLRRIGYTGELTLAAAGDDRSGTMRSVAMTANLDQMVVTGYGASAPPQAAKGAPVPSAGVSRSAVSPAPAQENKASDAARAVPVVARRTACEQ